MQLTLQAATPFDASLLWRFHNTYWEARGIEAWNRGEVPYYSTSNYASARQHAGFLTELVLSQLESGRLGADGEIWVLEVGSGLGRFATNFLRAMEVACGEAGSALSRIVTRVLGGQWEIAVPVIFPIEVGASLARVGEPVQEVQAYVEALMRVAAEVAALGPRRGKQLRDLAIASHLRAADAVYVWLAAREDVPLYTLDREVSVRGSAFCRVAEP